MSVWLTLPSARPLAEAEPLLHKWKERGYRVAVWRDLEVGPIEWADILVCNKTRAEYPGYAVAVNFLIQQAILMDSEAEWFVATGDDTLPDPHDPLEIAEACNWHFGSTFSARMCGDCRPPEGYTTLEWKHKFWDGQKDIHSFGVMQPTGDRWHEGIGGFANAPIDRVCGSPWLGREFCRRIYGGNGPFWPSFTHMFGDEHLQNVALKLGILWQRPDLVHKHLHWGRGATDKAIVNDPVIPEHLERWNTYKHWRESKAIFERLKAAGFREVEDLLP